MKGCQNQIFRIPGTPDPHTWQAGNLASWKPTDRRKPAAKIRIKKPDRDRPTDRKKQANQVTKLDLSLYGK
jgi:hypothetical protein